MTSRAYTQILLPRDVSEEHILYKWLEEKSELESSLVGFKERMLSSSPVQTKGKSFAQGALNHILHNYKGSIVRAYQPPNEPNASARLEEVVL